MAAAVDPASPAVEVLPAVPPPVVVPPSVVLSQPTVAAVLPTPPPLPPNPNGDIKLIDMAAEAAVVQQKAKVATVVTIADHNEDDDGDGDDGVDTLHAAASERQNVEYATANKQTRDLQDQVNILQKQRSCLIAAAVLLVAALMITITIAIHR